MNERLSEVKISFNVINEKPTSIKTMELREIIQTKSIKSINYNPK